MVNFVVCQDIGFDFLVKDKPVRPKPQNSALMPRPRTNITGRIRYRLYRPSGARVVRKRLSHSLVCLCNNVILTSVQEWNKPTSYYVRLSVPLIVVFYSG